MMKTDLLPMVKAYLETELLNDPSGFTPDEVKTILSLWAASKPLSPRYANALQRAFDRTKAAILHGRIPCEAFI